MNSSSYKFWLIACCAVALILVSCEDKSGNSTGPTYTATEDDYADASEDAGSAMADPDEGFLSMFETASDGSMRAEGGKSNDPAILSDTSYQRHGLLLTCDKTYYDADSNASEEYSSATTVRIFSGLSIEGSIVKPRRSADIHQTGYVNITGVTPSDEIFTLNGSIDRSVSSEFQAGWRGVRKEYNGTHEWTITNLKIGHDRLIYPYPISGEIRGTASFTRVHVTPGHEVTVTVTTNYTVTFDGSRYCKMTFASGMEFWIDLMTGWSQKERP